MKELDIAINEKLAYCNSRWNKKQQEKIAQSIKTICEQVEGLSTSDTDKVFEIAQELTYSYCFVKFSD